MQFKCRGIASRAETAAVLRLRKLSTLGSCHWDNGRFAVARKSRSAAAVAAKPAFTDRSLFAEGHAAAFRIELGAGSASGTLPWGAGENEIAKFLSEAIGLAKQMQAAMGGHAAVVEILVADQAAGASRQSVLKVSVEPSGATAVTLQAGGGGHLVAMLQHFLMALNPASRAAA
jgi:hypothetical protein